MPPIVTLTTDFGHQEPFVGIMKGVILSIAPDARLVDLCHEIPPQDLVAGALRLEAALPYFPDGTVHVVVVDPGVGTDRAALAIETRRGFLVGPDNGVLPAALDDFEQVVRVVRLTNTRYHLDPISRTFHGRDIFAPCAAHLASGVPLSSLGEPAETLTQLALPRPEWRDGAWHAHVVTRDRFGNLITDVRAEHVEAFGDERVVVRIGEARIPIRSTFGDVAPGELLAYMGSGGRLEIAVRNGSAESELAGVSELRIECCR